MNDQDKQNVLLQIIKTWNISEIPEYRGFKCACCQNYINQAWYHWISTPQFQLPLHLCGICEEKFKQNSLNINPPNHQQTFSESYQFSDNAKNHFEEIIQKWPIDKEPENKEFTCDECQKNLDIDPDDNQRKGYHVWYRMKNRKTLAELHFHRQCSQSFL